jgi:hypothetical protein
VFGDRFRYVLCRQIRQINGAWKHTALASLNIGDIILFGSCIDNRSKFALDTVFVVDMHTLLRPNGALPAWESNLHRDITMSVIRIPAVGLRLYGSKTWSQDQPFSFVPCLPAAPRPAVFRRPVIELAGIITPTHVMGYKISTLDDRSARAAWMAVVKQVIDQGCYLGTEIDEPS